MSMMKMMNWLDLKLFRLTKHELISSLGRDLWPDQRSEDEIWDWFPGSWLNSLEEVEEKHLDEERKEKRVW